MNHEATLSWYEEKSKPRMETLAVNCCLPLDVRQTECKIDGRGDGMKEKSSSVCSVSVTERSAKWGVPSRTDAGMCYLVGLNEVILHLTSMAFSVFSLHCLRIALPKWQLSASLCSSSGMNLPSKSRKIYEELGLPLPPKRPLTPYLLFTADVKDQIEFEKVTERAVIVAKKWRTLPNSERAKYLKEYEEAKVKYANELHQYNEQLGSQRLQQIETLKQQRKYYEKMKRESKQEKVLKKKTANVMGKPRPPLNGYLMFLEENAEKFNRSEPDFYGRAGRAWRDLGPAKQDEYKRRFQAAMDTYKSELAQWEHKMIETGRLDLVRKSSLAQLARSKASAAAKKVEE